jgi:hypothetical protein
VRRVQRTSPTQKTWKLCVSLRSLVANLNQPAFPFRVFRGFSGSSFSHPPCAKGRDGSMNRPLIRSAFPARLILRAAGSANQPYPIRILSILHCPPEALAEVGYPVQKNSASPCLCGEETHPPSGGLGEPALPHRPPATLRMCPHIFPE